MLNINNLVNTLIEKQLGSMKMNKRQSDLEADIQSLTVKVNKIADELDPLKVEMEQVTVDCSRALYMLPKC